MTASKIPLLILLACGTSGAAPVFAQTGTLAIYANGEDLATDGFIAPRLTRDGWALRFDHIYVTLSEIAAHQAEPPYDGAGGGPIAADISVALDGVFTLDLVDANADGRVHIGAVAAPQGHYNAISWRIAPALDGPSQGYGMVFAGTAEKNGQTIDFILRSADVALYRCGEYVGDERKGLVSADGKADLEITFHLDHVFGRADRDAGDPMNVSALGFDAFAAGGVHDIALAGLHVGHAGENHCSVQME